MSEVAKASFEYDAHQLWGTLFFKFISLSDVRGFDYPKPYFDTKVKVRWDDSKLYIAARMEEKDFWGTFTQDESLGNSLH